MDWIFKPWPWYIGGPLIGLMVPLALLIGNKNFGISSSFRHICAACIPANIDFFKYDWKAEAWNLYMVLGILVGSAIAAFGLTVDPLVQISENTVSDINALSISHTAGLNPTDLFSWQNLPTIRGIFFMVIGGFCVGFGTRYAGGCTSGHSITGLSNLQWPSLIATIAFFIGGLLMTHVLLPLILS